MNRRPADPPRATAPTHPPHALGVRGEALAAHFLEDAGWRIVARNVRLGRREIDLVARRGTLLTFVEVKTRTGAGFGGPESAVGWAKRREIEAVARAFLDRWADDDLDVRFDVVAIEIDARGMVERLEHIEDAWRPEPPR